MFFLPALGSLGGVLLSLTAGFVGKTIAALGISFVTYYGVYQALEWLKALAVQQLAGLPAEVLQLLALMQVGRALTILFACMFANMVMTGFNNDTFKKLTWGGGS